MFIGRLAGWVLLTAAVLLAGSELVHSLAAGHWAPTSLGALWLAIHHDSLEQLQRQLSPEIWDSLAGTLLAWPAWADLGGLGLILLLAFQTRAPKRKRRFD